MLPRKEKYMCILPVISRLASDCDLRNKFLKQFPGLLDSYELSKDGQIKIKGSGAQATDKYLLDGLSFISSRI
jgi:hypothetical protein